MVSARLRPPFARPRTRRRYYSSSADSSSISYHPKVRAFPFAFGADHAVRRLGWAAAPFLTPLDAICRAWAAGMWGAVEPVRPERLQAAYLPAWWVDAEVRGAAWLSPGGQDAVKVIIGLCSAAMTSENFHSYMPGFPFPPLSSMSFNNLSTDHAMANGNSVSSIFPPSVPYSPALLHQHDMSVIPMPYTVSPLRLPDFLRSLSYAQATVDEELRFDPGSIEVDFLAAYPILVPIYMAHYSGKTVESIDFNISCTVVIEAHITDGAVHVVDTTDDLTNLQLPDRLRITPFQNALASMLTLRTFLRNLVGPRPLLWAPGHGTPAPFARASALLAPGRRPQFAAKLQKWAAGRVYAGVGAWPAALVDGEGVDMDDARVREVSEEEVGQGRKWMNKGAEIAALKEMLEALDDVSDHHGRVIRVNLRTSQQEPKSPSQPNAPGGKTTTRLQLGPLSVDAAPAESMVDGVRAALRAMEEERERLAPAWWKEWVEKQGSG